MAERQRSRVEIESAAMSGTFDAILVRRIDAAPEVRLQLFPEFGGKLLDLALRPDRVIGYLPYAGLGLDVDLARGERLPRHLLSFIGVSLAESAAPISGARVRGSRACPEGWELQLSPVVAGTHVEVTVTAEGDVIERRFRLAGVSWAERRGPRRFEAEGFRLIVSKDERDRLESVPDALFELQLPEGLKP